MGTLTCALVALGSVVPSGTALDTRQAERPPATTVLAHALQRTFEELAEAGFSGAVLIVQGEEVLLDDAAGLADRAGSRINSPDTIYDVGSITKQFTATAILQLAQEGELSMDDTLSRFFEQVPADKKPIRLHHLLTHTSGLPPDVSVGSATTERDALVRACLAAKMQSVPGEQFVYNNVGYMLLGAIVEIASEQSYESYVSTHLFGPAGMSSSGFLGTPGVDTARVARGYEGRTAFGPGEQGWYSWGLRGAGGVLSTTGDLMRWWRALQTDAILSKRSRDQLFTPFLVDYAYGWWIRDIPSMGRLIEHGGTTRGFEAVYAHYLDHDLHVIVLCNDRGRSDAAAQTLLTVALGKRAAEAGAPASASELAAFAGEYEPPRGGKIVVHVDGDALTLALDDKAVIAQELRSGDAKLQNDPKLAERAEKLIELFDAGDAEGAQALMSTRYAAWNHRMVKVWERWLDERGKLEKVEPLGSSGDRMTLMRLVHDRRSVIWTLLWEDGVLSGWNVNGGLPEAGRFRSRSSSVFACPAEPGMGNWEYELSFERDPQGVVQRLTLIGGPLLLKAKRVR